MRSPKSLSLIFQSWKIRLLFERMKRPTYHWLLAKDVCVLWLGDEKEPFVHFLFSFFYENHGFFCGDVCLVDRFFSFTTSFSKTLRSLRRISTSVYCHSASFRLSFLLRYLYMLSNSVFFTKCAVGNKAQRGNRVNCWSVIHSLLVQTKFKLFCKEFIESKLALCGGASNGNRFVILGPN